MEMFDIDDYQAKRFKMKKPSLIGGVGSSPLHHPGEKGHFHSDLQPGEEYKEYPGEHVSIMDSLSDVKMQKDKAAIGAVLDRKYQPRLDSATNVADKEINSSSESLNQELDGAIQKYYDDVDTGIFKTQEEVDKEGAKLQKYVDKRTKEHENFIEKKNTDLETFTSKLERSMSKEGMTADWTYDIRNKHQDELIKASDKILIKDIKTHKEGKMSKKEFMKRHMAGDADYNYYMKLKL